MGKKKPKNGGKYTFIWIAVDRGKNKVVDFEIGDRSKQTWLKLALRLESKYKINNLCTDGYEAYKTFKISKHHHQTKAETSLVESINSQIRNYLAKFNRKTKRYSKSISAVRDALTLFFNRNMIRI